MKTKLFISIFFAAVIICSCKKEEKQPTTPTTTGGTGGGGGGGGSNYPASTASAFSGIFTTGHYIGTFVSGTTTINFDTKSASAYFSNTPASFVNPTSAITVSNVALNGDSLWYNSSSKYYFSNSTSSTGISLASETWSVTGANGIGTFTVANVFTTPSASGYTAWPNAISKANTYIFMINNVSNATGANFLISDGGSGFYFKALQSGNNTFTVTPNDLSALSTTTMGSIALVLENKKAFIISGKDYKFTREFQYTKPLQLTN